MKIIKKNRTFKVGIKKNYFERGCQNKIKKKRNDNIC